MAGDHALISLDGLSKVFYTEEVETHALSNINLAVKPGEFVQQHQRWCVIFADSDQLWNLSGCPSVHTFEPGKVDPLLHQTWRLHPCQ